MARVRPATERIRTIGAGPVRRALEASAEAGSIDAFYRVVGMRNPSRSYFVQWRGQLHSLKGVATFALREEVGSTISRDFHAADAAERFRDLGFAVVHGADKAEEDRRRVWMSRLSRDGQARFRESLIDLYGKCAFTGCTTLPVLEAAHVNPVKNKGCDAPSNGILLRVDIHRLFDAGYIAVDPSNGRIAVAATCGADYGRLFKNIRFSAPQGGPSLEAFAER